MTEGERKFLRAYRRSLDEEAAFQASGLSRTPGKSDRACGRAMLRKLKKEKAALEAREAELEKPSLARIKAEIAHIAFDDIGRYLSFQEGENGFEVHPLPSGLVDTRSISEVSVGAGGKMTLKLYSKERALFKLFEIMAAGEDEQDDFSLLEALRGIRSGGEEEDCTE